uniref:FAD-binding domain-containing protein n=1 Tax=Amphimedon queenslandica TaxID=400682 RepID=A0A1X7TVF7_AMPQE
MAHCAEKDTNNGEGVQLVAVIGGGLVGPLQALYLARNGLKVYLFESKKDIRKSDSGAGRSINLTISTRGIEALEAIGLRHVLSEAVPVYGRMKHSLDGTTSTMNYSSKGEAIHSINRLKLNQALLEAAERDSNITLHFEHKLHHADLKKQLLTFKTPEGEKEVTVGFTFGCDGTFSTVRDQMLKSGGFNYSFSQECIEHGYKELRMKPHTNDAHQEEFAMTPDRLHLWPRQEFTMVALPNPDKSFTLALFMPFDKFETIASEEKLLPFFEEHFPDSIDKIGKEELVNDFKRNPTGSLYSIKCNSYYHCSAVLLGDAAHAVVPFFGQGTNAGMEDCLIFDERLKELKKVGGKGGRIGLDDLKAAAKAYSDDRWEDGQAIADLSMINYEELKSPQKHPFDESLYNMVAFTRKPYRKYACSVL